LDGLVEKFVARLENEFEFLAELGACGSGHLTMKFAQHFFFVEARYNDRKEHPFGTLCPVVNFHDFGSPQDWIEDTWIEETWIEVTWDRIRFVTA
jgi:hypothetical protein